RLRGRRARVAHAGATLALDRDRRVARARIPRPGTRTAARPPGLGTGFPAADVLRRLRGPGAARGRREAPEAEARARRADRGGHALQRARVLAASSPGCIPSVRE